MTPSERGREEMPWKVMYKPSQLPDNILISLRHVSFIIPEKEGDAADTAIAIVKKKKVTPVNHYGCGTNRNYTIVTPIKVRGGVRLFKTKITSQRGVYVQEVDGYKRELPYATITYDPYYEIYGLTVSGAAVFKRMDDGDYKITADRDYDAILVVLNHSVNSRSHDAVATILTPTPYGFVSEASSCALESTVSMVGLWPANQPVVAVVNRPPYRGSDVDWEVRKLVIEKGVYGWRWVATFNDEEDAIEHAKSLLTGEPDPRQEDIV